MLKQTKATVFAVLIAFIGALIVFFLATSAPALLVVGKPNVRIEANGGVGSGVNLGDGRILTAAHVVLGKDATFTVIDEDGNKVFAYLSRYDEAADWAIIRVHSPLPTSAVAGVACEIPAIGTAVEIVGNPHSFRFIHSWGRIASALVYGSTHDWASFLFVDAPIRPGNSGGGVYADGILVAIAVGVNTRMFEPTLPLSIIVPTSEIPAVCPRIS